MFKVAFIVGMPGSGKTIVSDYLVEKGYKYVRFGQIVLDKIKEQGLEVNEDNERKIREQLREEYGQCAFASLNMPKIDEYLKDSFVVVDGLYSWSEYKLLKEKYQDKMLVIAIYAPPELRYQRLETRPRDANNRFRPIPKDKAKERDYSEIEKIEKGGPIAMADYTILNTSTKEKIQEQLRDIFDDQN